MVNSIHQLQCCVWVLTLVPWIALKKRAKDLRMTQNLWNSKLKTKSQYHCTSNRNYFLLLFMCWCCSCVGVVVCIIKGVALYFQKSGTPRWGWEDEWMIFTFSYSQTFLKHVKFGCILWFVVASLLWFFLILFVFILYVIHICISLNNLYLHFQSKMLRCIDLIQFK